jgi:serine phosphatase RsbU (regulator of sigma subunit)
MGRVRPALRAYVLEGHGPWEAIRRLDQLMKENTPPEMTTVFHLQFDPAAMRARYVRAGHLPGVLRLPDGSVELLAGGGTPPLGILEGIDYHEHDVELPSGSLLLLYTDGLIERPGGDLGDRLEELRAAMASAPADPDACLDWLAERFGVAETSDDVAMLAMSPN